MKSRCLDIFQKVLLRVLCRIERLVLQAKIAGLLWQIQVYFISNAEAHVVAEIT